MDEPDPDFRIVAADSRVRGDEKAAEILERLRREAVAYADALRQELKGDDRR